MKKEHYLYAIEAILFVSPRPLKIDKIARALSLDKSVVSELILELAELRKDTGINLLIDRETVSLVPNESFRKYFERFVRKKKVTLSKSMLEVIGLLLKKKRTKEEIDKLRALNSTRTINELLKIGYIEKEFYEGKVFYKLSEKFFKSLGEEAKKQLESKLFNIS